MDAEFTKKVKQKKIRKWAIAVVLIIVCVIVVVSVTKPGKKKGDGTSGVATIEIRCDQLAKNPESLKDPALTDYLPSDGIILPATEVDIVPGVTNVFEITDKVCKEKNIQIEYSYSPGYDSHYIEGINYFYEFSAGTYSGWIFTVNGKSANYGADKIVLNDGDAVVWNYTVDYRMEETPVMGEEASGEPDKENRDVQSETAGESRSEESAGGTNAGEEPAAGGQTERSEAAVISQNSENDTSDAGELKEIRDKLAHFLMEQNPSPIFSPIGGEWLIKGLVCSGIDVPQDYYETYYQNVCKTVEECKGILSDKRYTEYERAIIGLSAIDKSVTDVAGYDLTPYIDDFDKVTWQGVNAACYAIIAAREGGISLTNEDAYAAYIIDGLSDGKMNTDMAYADYLAFGLEALSFHAKEEDAAAFIEDAVKALSELQAEDGSYGNCEATAEVIVGLTMAGIDPVKDDRFIKTGNNLVDGLMRYYNGEDGFTHLYGDEKTDLMSCEKAFLAMDAILLAENGEKLYG